MGSSTIPHCMTRGEMGQEISVISCLELWKNGGVKRVTENANRSASSFLAKVSSMARTIKKVSRIVGMDVANRYPCPTARQTPVIVLPVESTHRVPVALERLLRMLQGAVLLGVWLVVSLAALVQCS